MAYRNKTSILVAIAGIVATLGMMTPLSFTVNNTVKATTPILGGIAHIQGADDGNHTVIVITKNGTGARVPEGPVIVIPPNSNNTENGNGTIVTPPANETIIIEPGGNITEIPNGNVTEIDNGTVIVSDENQTITETPGNVTVIDPPVPTHPIVLPPANETSNVNNNHTCTCNQTQQPIPPVQVTPAPGQNVTTGNPVLPGERPPFVPSPDNNNTNANNNNNQTNHAQQLPVTFSVPRI